MVKVKVKNESKHEKFRRLATGRTQKVLDALRILGNCTNTQTYEYTREEVEKIFENIRTTTEEIKQKFMHKITNKHIFEL
ncbi:hypothetical protein LCGC14_2722220 [marine sediment metagenome]|uniref:Uncharacterized protein n=1 Tax=marine sediment metagenome TaxID=412755 RepID=A0A0F8Z9P7_9ZZZZ